MFKYFILFLICIIISFIVYDTKHTLVENNKQIIPLNIFQTWETKDLPPRMNECVRALKLCNPEFRYYLFDDKECRDFIKNNFDDEVLYSYDRLIPGAFKADLWRYCILYKLGGIYLDIKYECVNGFKFITLTTDEYFVRDRYDVSNKSAVYNALMICKPGNEILSKCIRKIVENVKMKFYGLSALQITGPKMMIEFFTPNEKRKLNDLYHFDKNGYYYIVHGNQKILMIYPEYRREQAKHQGIKHYSVLWSQRKVYA
jgi:mannosyltransferase OCH1-like enzyme